MEVLEGFPAELLPVLLMAHLVGFLVVLLDTFPVELPEEFSVEFPQELLDVTFL